MFVGNAGSSYASFRRALDAGQLNKSLEFASELQTVKLDDALDLVELLADRGDERFEAAARRWLERFAVEYGPSVHRVAMAAAALAELGRYPSSVLARDTLEQLLIPPGATAG